jgi:tousled-like kinase
MTLCLDKGDGGDAETSMSEEDILLQDEICKSRQTSIKPVHFLGRGLFALLVHLSLSAFCYCISGGRTVSEKIDRHELEKGRLIRDMKRLRDEDGPCFNNFQILHHR